jgi:hypothetical protein
VLVMAVTMTMLVVMVVSVVMLMRMPVRHPRVLAEDQ